MATNDSEEEYETGGLEIYCETTSFSTINGAAYIAIFIISVTFNTLLLFVLLRYEKLKSVTDLFVLNLACSDLVFTFTLVFFAVQELHYWVFGDYACQILITAYFAGEYSSVMLLTAMTVDRFKTVVLHKWTNQVRRQRCAMVACASAWVVGIAGSLVDTFKANVWELKCTCSSSSDVLSLYLQVSLLFFLPFVIIVICYSAILWKVLHPSNRRKMRTVVVLLVIVIVFFICWGPYNVFLLIEALYPNLSCEQEQYHSVAYLISGLLAYSHCFMNPLLYMNSQKLRRHLWRLLPCDKLRGKNREKTTTVSIMQNAAFNAQNSAVMLQ